MMRVVTAASLLLTLAVTGFGCHSKTPEEAAAPASSSAASTAVPDDPAGAQAKASGEQAAAYHNQHDEADALARKAAMEKAGQK